jgi:signal transduction histidine kinase/HPt (histidine-containing phosphotransfer) domain-containing protein
MSTRILVVEDSRTEAMRARLILEHAGFQVSLALDGQEGLQKAGTEKPDLILMDTLMPKVNGFEACGKLKLDPKTMHIPVVMMVYEGEAADMPSGAALDCLLVKPYEPNALVDKVKQFAQTNNAAPVADAGEIQRYQQELRAARQEIVAAQKARMDFLANMSHELRTPLHEIIGMTELMQNTPLSPEQAEYLKTAHASSNALLMLISDVIEFSELEAGQLGLEEKPFELAEPLERTLELVRPRAADKGIALRTVIDACVPQQLIGDANRLRQVLVNLVANAVKFTDKGEVVVSVQCAENSEPNTLSSPLTTLHFSIHDTGIGIPHDRHAIIFEPFQQVDSSATRRFGGLGMGLALTKQLVKLMGGRIWVESEPGKGSTFHFTVRLPTQAQTLPAAKSTGIARALRILVAEDSPTNQLIARSSLTKAGHTVTIANNGIEAVNAFDAGQFDLILMDVAMPEMDGLDATRMIREKEKAYGGHSIIVAMTAFATKEYQTKCFEAGMDAYVTKPVRIDELNKTIAPLFASASAAPAESPVNLRDALEVVGDDVDILRDAVAASLAEVPAELQLLKEAMAQQNAHGVEAKAHRLKGVMGNLGGTRAREIGQQLETMGEQGNLANGRAVLAQFEQEIARVIAFYADPAWEQQARTLGG